MFAILGVTGNIGGDLARRLLEVGKPVRAVVRDKLKATAWAERGCEFAVAGINETAALTTAFEDAEGVFVLVPPMFDPLPGFPEAEKIAASLLTAIETARPERVVYLSTIGAQAAQMNLLTQHTIIEKALNAVSTPITFLRPAWFMENSRWDVAPARERGVIPSFLQPIDKAFPMVATTDIGRVAAEAIQETWEGHRLIELEGPQRVSPNDIAMTFSKLLSKPVQIEAVPRSQWESMFRTQGMKNPEPRIRMLDGFNEGWIEFERSEAGSRKGKTELKTVLRTLLEAEGHKAAAPGV